MFHLLNYTVNGGVNDVNVDMTASIDPVISQRNSHFIFTEQHRVLAFMGMGTSLLRVRANIPSWNAIVRHYVDPPNRSATIPSNAQGQWFTEVPLQFPLNEEIAFEESNDLAMGNERENLFIWIAPPGWTRNVPQGRPISCLRFTASVAGVANAWSSLGGLTFSDTVRGGIYNVVGCEIFDAGTLAFRLLFPKAQMYAGRPLRPGTLCREAIGNVPFGMAFPGPWVWGSWGRFHTFEPPQLEVYANATGASTQEGRMYVVYEGEANTL